MADELPPLCECGKWTTLEREVEKGRDQWYVGCDSCGQAGPRRSTASAALTAARITAQAKRIEELEGALRIAEKALKPLAGYADCFRDHWPDTGVVSVNVGDLRRARTACALIKDKPL